MEAQTKENTPSAETEAENVTKPEEGTFFRVNTR